MTTRVVVTTSPGSLRGLEAQLAGLDVTIHRHPLLEFLPPNDPAALDRALAVPTKWSAIVVTSPRGSRVLAERWRGARPAELPPTWSSGDATSRSLREIGLTVHEAPASDGPVSAGEALVAEMLSQPLASPVLYLAGDPHRPELPARLADAGVRVEVVHVYRSVPVSDVELFAALSRADLLVVGSPAVVASLATQGDDATLPAWIAIGATTAEAVRAARLPLMAIADAPTPDGVADAIRRTLQLLHPRS